MSNKIKTKIYVYDINDVGVPTESPIESLKDHLLKYDFTYITPNKSLGVITNNKFKNVIYLKIGCVDEPNINDKSKSGNSINGCKNMTVYLQWNIRTDQFKTILIYDKEQYTGSEVLRIAREIQKEILRSGIFNNDNATTLKIFYDEQSKTDVIELDKIKREYYKQNGTVLNNEDFDKLFLLMLKLYGLSIGLYKTYKKSEILEESIRRLGTEPSEFVRQYMDDFIEDYTNEHPNHNAIVDKLSKDIEREYEFDVTIGVHTPVDLNYSSDFNFKDIIKSNPERSKQIVDFYPKLLDELKSKLNIYGFTPYIIPH